MPDSFDWRKVLADHEKQVNEQAAADLAAAQAQNAGENLELSGLKSGLAGLKSTFHGFQAMGHSMLGDPVAAQREMLDYTEQANKAAEHQAPADFWSDDPEKSVLANPGKNLVPWARWQLANLAPSVAESVVTGAAGAVAGGMMVPGPDPTDVAAVPGGFIAGALGKQGVKKMMKEFIEARMKQGVAREVAAKEIEAKLAGEGGKALAAQAGKQYAKRLGMNAGIVAGTQVPEAGGMYGDLAQKGIDAPFTSAAFGLVSGLSEVYMGAFPAAMRAVLGRGGAKIAKEMAEKQGKASAAGYLWDLFTGTIKEGGKSVAEETAQEGFQQFLQEINNEINDPAFKIFDRESWMRMANSAAAGGLGGLVMGGPAGLATSIRETPLPKYLDESVDVLTGERKRAGAGQPGATPAPVVPVAPAAGGGLRPAAPTLAGSNMDNLPGLEAVPPPSAPARPAAGGLATPAPVLPAAPEGIDTRAKVERPGVGMVLGGPVEASTPQGGAKVTGRYALADIRDLVTSDQRDYDQKLQPRDRSTVASREQVAEIAAKPDWMQLGQSTITDSGAPLVDGRGMVVSGNGRVAGLRGAYQVGRADDYRANILRHAQELGVKGGENIEFPVLVRVAEQTTHPLPQVAEWSNRTRILTRTGAETAEADAKLLTGTNIMDLYQPDEEGNPLAASNREFMNDFVRQTGAQELRSSGGGFMPEAVTRVGRAVLGAMFAGSDRGRALTRALVEDVATLGIQNQVDVVKRFAGLLMQVARQKPEFDIIPDMALALDDLVRFRKELQAGESRTVEQYLSQMKMDDVQRTAVSTLIFRRMAAAVSKKDVADWINAYLDTVKQIDTKHDDLFGAPNATPAEIFQDILSREQKLQAELQRRFDNARAPTPTPAPAEVPPAQVSDQANPAPADGEQRPSAVPAPAQPQGSGGLSGGPAIQQQPAAVVEPQGLAPKPAAEPAAPSVKVGDADFLDLLDQGKPEAPTAETPASAAPAAKPTKPKKGKGLADTNTAPAPEATAPAPADLNDWMGKARSALDGALAILQTIDETKMDQADKNEAKSIRNTGSVVARVDIPQDPASAETQAKIADLARRAAALRDRVAKQPDQAPPAAEYIPTYNEKEKQKIVFRVEASLEKKGLMGDPIAGLADPAIKEGVLSIIGAAAFPGLGRIVSKPGKVQFSDIGRLVYLLAKGSITQADYDAKLKEWRENKWDKPAASAPAPAPAEQPPVKKIERGHVIQPQGSYPGGGWSVSLHEDRIDRSKPRRFVWKGVVDTEQQAKDIGAEWDATGKPGPVPTKWMSPAQQIGDFRTEPPVPAPRPEIKSPMANVSDADRKRMEELKARLRKKAGQANVMAGFDPEFLTIAGEMAGIYIKGGVKTFAQFAAVFKAEMSDVWDNTKIYLQAAWNAATSATGGDLPDVSRAEAAAVIEALDNTPNTTHSSQQEIAPSESDQTASGAGDLPGVRGQGESPVAGGVRGPGGEQQSAGVQSEGGGDRPDVGNGVPADAGGAEAVGRPVDVSGQPAGRPAQGSEGQPGADGLLGGGTGSGTGNDSVKPGNGSGVAPGSQPTSIPGRENYHLTNPERLLAGGQKSRFERNRKALEVLDTLRLEQRVPTPAELDDIAAWTGWGSFGQSLFQGSWEHPAVKPEWKDEYDWLRNHLGEAGWKSAQESIINAHYTDPFTVSTIWKAIQHMGFTDGGRILEPSIGIGNFFGLMPREIMARSELTGIELEQSTGEMAKTLYPRANIQIKGYQDSKTADNFYDLIMGNWPFAKDGPSDRRYNPYHLSLHNYFFVKALDQVRPGGFVVGITSSGTMDQKTETARRQMAKRGELVAAFRFPTGAFKGYAGTDVVADLLIFKKRKQPLVELGPTELAWVSNQVKADDGDYSFNQYWKDHRNHVLGKMKLGSHTTTGRPGMTVERLGDFEAKMNALPGMLPAGIFEPWVPTASESKVKYIANTEGLNRQNAATIKNGDLFRVEGEQLARIEDIFPWRSKDAKKTEKRLREAERLLLVRDRLDALMRAYREATDTQAPESARRSLKQAYELFVKNHGPISDSFMLKILDKAGEPSAKTLDNLEDPDTKGPRAIMTRDIMRRPVLAAQGSIQDAYAIHRNNSLTLNIEDVAKAAGVTVEEATKKLVEFNAIFQTPAGTWEHRDQYLGGNVRRKLREAQDAAEQHGMDMARNIAELEKNQPKDVPYFDIEVQMGAAWIPRSDYKDFIYYLMNLPADSEERKKIDVVKQASGWKVVVASYDVERSAEATTRWGHPSVTIAKMLSAAMNGTSILVTAKDRDGKESVLEKQTSEANDKVSVIREELVTWLWRDPERTARLARDYNEAMNSEVTPIRDGSYLRLEGLSLSLGSGEFDFRKHQKDAVARGLQDRRGMFFHEVGTGKTFTIAGLVMEGRRLGRFRKVMVMAHNANSEAVANDIRRAYPAAKVLYVNNLSPANRDSALRQIMLDDWDAVVVPHSLIDRFQLKIETLKQQADKEIKELEAEIYSAGEDLGVDLTRVNLDDPKAVAKLLGRKQGAHTAKELVRMRRRIVKRIEDMAAKAQRETGLYFEDLGVDSVMVDEAHMFKKTGATTKKSIKGLQKDVSERAWMLKSLTNYVKAQNGGNGVFLFTGTPLTNNLNEAYSMMHYIMDDSMSEISIERFDDWFNAFAATTTETELTSGGTYEPVERLLAFVNVPELARTAGKYFDVVRAKDMPEFKPRESHDGITEDPVGLPYKQMVPVIMEMSEAQAEHYREVQERYLLYQKLSKKDKRLTQMTGGDVPIKMENEGVESALDFRLLRPGAADFPGSKVNKMVGNLMQHYNEHEKATQMVFMERGVNDFVDRQTVVRGEGGFAVRDDDGNSIYEKSRVEKFNVLRDIVEKLVAQGVDPKEIAVFSNMNLFPVKDGKKDDVMRQVRKLTAAVTKEDLADLMREGKVRIAFGGTETMGTGVNAQTWLRSIHHLDAPWTPGAMEQRNGRGHRQGNKWNTLFEYRYFTEGGHDGKRWQTLLGKVRFITRFTDMLRKGGKVVRVLEGDGADLSEGEATDTAVSDFEKSFSIATGDPRILLRAKLEKQVEKLERRRSNYLSGQQDARLKIVRDRENIADSEKRIVQYSKDLESYQATAAQPFSLEVMGKVYTDRDAADEALKALPKVENGTVVAKRGEFAMIQQHGWTLVAPSKNQYWPITPSSAGIDGKLRQIPKHIADFKADIVNLKRGIASLEEQIQQPFGRQADLDAKVRALAQVVLELQASPNPAPAWLRLGAPQGSLIYVDGEPLEVQAHRWDKNGYWILVEGEHGLTPIRYGRATDENGTRLLPDMGSGAEDGRPEEEPVAETVAMSVPPGGASGVSSGWGHQDTILYRQADEPAGAVPPARAEQHVRAMVGAWIKAGQVGIARAEADLPAGVRARIAQDRRGRLGAAGKVKGIFYAGKAWIVLDGHSDLADLTRTVLHETVGHFGIRELMGLMGRPELFREAAANADVAAAARRLMAAHPGMGQGEAVEEVLAGWAEAGTPSGIMDRIVAAVVEWLRRVVGGRWAPTNAEIRQILSRAKRMIDEGPHGPGGGGRRGPAGSRYLFAGAKGLANVPEAAAKAMPARQLAEAMAAKAGITKATEANRDEVERIRLATDWLLLPSGALTFEVSDQNARVRPMEQLPERAQELMLTHGTPAVKLGELLDHPTLFRLYPELAGYGVGLDPEMKGAYFNSDTKEIFIGYDPATGAVDLRKLIHEVQHAIAQVEGFPAGGDPSTVASEHPAEYAAAIAEGTPEDRARRGIYDRLGGERMARASASRTAFTQDERRDLAPNLGDLDTWITRKDGQGREAMADDVVDANWLKQLDDLQAGKFDRSQSLQVGPTPKVLLAVGADQLPIVMAPAIVDKVTSGNPGEHAVTMDVLRNIPEQLRDPIAVFQSTQHGDGLTVMTELREGDKTIIVAIHLNRRESRHEVNSIRSIYGKENDWTFANWARDGLLLYVNKQKSRSWSQSRGVQFPKEGARNGASRKVLTEGDVPRSQDNQAGGNVKPLPPRYRTDAAGAGQAPAGLVARAEQAVADSYEWFQQFREAGKLKDLNGRPDISRFDLLFRTIFHYAKRVPALRRMFDAAQGFRDRKHQLGEFLFGAGEQELGDLHKWAAADKTGWAKVQDYLWEQDAAGAGYVVRKEGGIFKVFGPDGRFAGTFQNENDAWDHAFSEEAQDLTRKGFAEAEAGAVRTIRVFNARQYEMLRRSAREFKAQLDQSGTNPAAVEAVLEGIDGTSEKVTLGDLFTELEKMGDRRGHYMPRIRPSGQYKLTATKAGEEPRLEVFAMETARRARAVTLKQGGWDVKFTLSNRPSEESFLGGNIVALNDLIMNALDRVQKAEEKGASLSTFGLKGERTVYKNKQGQDETHLVITGSITPEIKQVLKEFGAGRWSSTQDQHGEAWRLKDFTPGLEKKLAKALLLTQNRKLIASEVFARDFLGTMASVIHSRGSRARKIGRNDGWEVWQGFEKDAIRAVTQAGRAVAGGSAKREMAQAMMKAMTGTDISWAEYKAEHGPAPAERKVDPAAYQQAMRQAWFDYEDMVDERRIDSATQPNAFKEGGEYMREMLRNEEPAERIAGIIRGLAGFKYLSGVAPALVNLTSMVTTVPAAMKAFAGIDLSKAPGLLIRGSNGYLKWVMKRKFGKGAGVTEDEAWLYDSIRRNGWDEALMNQEATGILQSSLRKGWSTVMDKAMLLFGVTEQFNRGTTIAAVYFGLREQGMDRDAALAKAKEVSDTAHGVYGKTNLPAWARGSSAGAMAARSFYVFKTFMHNYLQVLWEMGADKKDAKAFAFMLLSPAIIAGPGALLGKGLLVMMAKAFAAVTMSAPPDDPEEAYYRWVDETFGWIPGRAARLGLSGLLGLNLKGSMAINITDMPTSPLDLLGAPAGIVEDVAGGAASIARGDVVKGVEKVSPRIVAGPIRAAREHFEGVTDRTNKPVYWGNERLRSSLYQSLLRGLAFNPAGVSEKTEQQWGERQATLHAADTRNEIYAQVRRFMLAPAPDRDPEAWLAILDEIEAYNEKVAALNNPSISYISQSSLKNAIRSVGRPPRRERIRAGERVTSPGPVDVEDFEEAEE
jgi:N12 class adenine-specific DNA methylase